jgi:hypothetical protein
MMAKVRRRRTAPKTKKANAVDIASIYSSVQKKLRPLLVIKTADDIGNYYVTCLKAAISKCLDFNIAITSADVRKSDAFFYVAGLRGICEDLIVLRYLYTVDPLIRCEYLEALLGKNLAEGVSVQNKFFRENNPLQPLIGSPFPIGNEDKDVQDAQIEANLIAARQKYDAAAGRLGLGRRPAVRTMATSIGLVATYDFIYFLVSNYVHFNPASFLKFGWTKEKDRNFNFDVANMSDYYGATAIFYGAVLFIGFANFIFRMDEFKRAKVKRQIGRIERFIGSLHRWPEIVTFEEMNVRPPQFFLLHAMREVMRSSGDVKYGEILNELKGAAIQK